MRVMFRNLMSKKGRKVGVCLRKSTIGLREKRRVRKKGAPQGFYEYIDKANILTRLKELLICEDHTLREKACSAIGIICRHSSHFYNSLSRHGIISLIDRCADPDKPTRKYACFAIGNVAFHNELLYEELRRSIPQLTKVLLSKEEDKIKANVAGALSNLVRNSNKLREDMVTKGAIQPVPTPESSTARAPETNRWPAQSPEPITWVDPVEGPEPSSSPAQAPGGTELLYSWEEVKDVQDRHMRATVADNHFGKGLIQRLPRYRFGYFHVVNNDNTHWVTYAICGSASPTIYSQGNRFLDTDKRSSKTITKHMDASEDEWRTWNWRSEGDLFLNGTNFITSGTKSLSAYDKVTSLRALPASLVLEKLKTRPLVPDNTRKDTRDPTLDATLSIQV